MECEKEIPQLFSNKKECCGCTACVVACPRLAICMLPDEFGFDYPTIDKELCIRCGMCLKVCPLKK